MEIPPERRVSCGVLPLLFGASALLLVGFAPERVAAKELRVTKESGVSFLAKITMGSFVARSTAVAGAVDYDPETGTLRAGVITVKADSFDTGISLRNAHMRDKYLEANKFPLIRFKTLGATLTPTAGAEGEVSGVFVIKGVEKPAKVKVKVASVSDAGAVFESTFPLNVNDFGIPQPAFTGVKMDPVIEVTLKLVLQEPR